MPDRKYQGPNYRFGFNGKENDQDVKGLGNQIGFENRIYDPRIARWLSTDPLQINYPYLTPYNFTANSPIVFGDYDGKDFGIIYDHKNKKIYIVGNYYVTNQESAQMSKALSKWNTRSAVTNEGYTVIFSFKTKIPEMQTKEEFVKGAPHLEKLSKSKQEKMYKQYVDNMLWAAKEADPIGNAYYGSDFVASTRQSTASTTVEGGVTRGDYIYMNTADDGTDFAKNPELVAHEVGHTLGLQDPPKSKAAVDKKPFHPEGGIMEYTTTGSQLPINNNDVKAVLAYARAYVGYQLIRSLIPGVPANKNFEGRAKVGAVMTTEFGRAINGAISSMHF